MRSRLRLLPFALFLFILPFPGTVALRLAALACGLLVCAWSWYADGLPRVPAKAALALWAGCALLSLGWAVDPAYSLGEIKNEVFYALAAFLGLFTLTRTREDAAVLLNALMLAALVLAALAFWEHFSSGSDIWNERGPAGGSGSYATYLLALFPVLLWAGGALRYRYARALLAALALAQLYVAVLAGQRAFWLVFGPQALVALYLLRARGFIAIAPARLRALGAAALVLCALAIAAATLTRGTVGLAHDPRVTGWPAIAARILEHPLVGKGFGRQTMKMAYPDLVSREFPLFWHPHNLFLEYGIAMGIPGMLALIYLFYALLRRFWQMSRADEHVSAMAGICGVLLVVGVIARNLTNDFFLRDQALLFWALAGMLLGYAAHSEDAARSERERGHGSE